MGLKIVSHQTASSTWCQRVNSSGKVLNNSWNFQRLYKLLKLRLFLTRWYNYVRCKNKKQHIRQKKYT